jgi:hypothetical protein
MDLQLHIDAAGSWLVSTAIRLTRPHCTPMQAMLDAIKAQQASAFTDRGRSSSQGRLHTAGLRRAVGTPWQQPRAVSSWSSGSCRGDSSIFSDMPCCVIAVVLGTSWDNLTYGLLNRKRTFICSHLQP